MDTKIIELRMSVAALPAKNRETQLAAKAEVWRLAELLGAQNTALTERVAALESHVSSLIGLARGLEEDDPYFFEQRGGEDIISAASSALSPPPSPRQLHRAGG